jgi:hypothetical protein
MEWQRDLSHLDLLASNPMACTKPWNLVASQMCRLQVTRVMLLLLQ